MEVKTDKEQMEFIPENESDIFKLGIMSTRVKEGYQISYRNDKIMSVKYFTDDVVDLALKDFKTI